MPLHLVGISGGRVWHTIRRTGGWDPWDELLASAGSLPTSPTGVACGFVRGALHVCVATTQSAPTTRRGLFHTIRFARGNWQSWGDARLAAFSQLSSQSFDSIDCVGMAGAPGTDTGQLHVCVNGFTVGATGTQSLRAVWHAIRTSNPNPALDSWTTPSRQVTDGYGEIWDLACANIGGGQLHILARCTHRTSLAELLIHTIRFADGTLQSGGDQDVFSTFPNANALRATRLVAAAGIGPQLHVIASDGTELFHTIRLNDSAWQPTFGPVRAAVDATFTSPLTLPACANESGNLHICAISGGRIMHTIRVSNPPAWRNPETASSGRFGNVLAVVPPGPTGAPPAGFSNIACAGE